MIGTLLLYLLVSDVRDYSDNELYELLELMLSLPENPDSADLAELKEDILDQLEEGQLDRPYIATWPEAYWQLLPESMHDYPKAAQQFSELLKATPEETEENESDRLARFQTCLDMLDEGSDWKARSSAARGLGLLEEELFELRDQYMSQPFQIEQCSPTSVVAHRQLLEGFESWQRAFGLTHQGDLDGAFAQALFACKIFRAVESWSRTRVTVPT